MPGQHFLSGYRLMWMMVMFDLPTMSKAERKEYTRFRNYLLDSGFSMSQYSVYFRLVSSKERVKGFERKIADQLPVAGKVQIITITDKQYENIKSFYGQGAQDNKKTSQLQLF